MRAWDYGKRVCLVEKNKLGGAGVHHGALSSKTYWELSRDYLNARREDRGFHAQALHVELAQVTECVRTAVDEKTRQLHTQLRAHANPDDGMEAASLCSRVPHVSSTPPESRSTTSTARPGAR